MAGRGHHILVVGAGSIGERHIRCFLQTGRARVSLVEPRAELRARLIENDAAVSGFENLDAALDAGSMTAAVIATPAPLHVGQATRLVSRGLHVLIEKPLGVTRDGIDELLAALEGSRVTAAVAYVYRAHPALMAMRDAICRGEFGRPVELVAVCGQHFPTYRPGYRQTYYTRHESGGGAVQDALTHIINAAEWIIGPADRVVADVSHQLLEGTSVEDTAHVLARHGEILSSFTLNQHQAPNEVTITVICERGTARFEYHENRWRSMRKPGEPWTDHVIPALARDALFIRQAGGFLDAIEGKSPPACTVQEGLQTLRVNLGILSSARDGTWVRTRN